MQGLETIVAHSITAYKFLFLVTLLFYCLTLFRLMVVFSTTKEPIMYLGDHR